jgi:hypothetical protein
VRTPARAHAFHVALAEVEWNPATRALELGVRLDANDLERRLSLATGRSIVLDRAPDAAVLVRDLLRHTLTIRPRGGAPLPLRWVGMEVGLHHAWAFAEVPSPAGPGGLEVRMATLHDLEPTQLNTVNAIADGDARSVTFARGDGFKPLRWPD